MTTEVVSTVPNRWSLWLPLAGVAALLAAGYYPTWRICGDAGTRAMLAALCLVAGVVYASLLPAVRQIAVSKPVERLKIGFRAAVIRMVLTLAVAALVAWKTWVQPGPFVVWVAISYVLLIKVETLVLLRWIRQDEKRTR